MADDFKYDVAFSFLTIDEPIAVQLHTKLKGRLSSFYYAEPERQKRLSIETVHACHIRDRLGAVIHEYGLAP